MSEIFHLCESPTKYGKWKIKNFFDLPTKDKYELKSSQFYLFNSKWFFKIYPNGCVDNNSAGFIDIFLFREDSFFECDIYLKMGIINADGSKKFKAFFDKASFSKENCGSGFSNIVRRSTLKRFKNTLVPNGTLTVFCYVCLINPRPDLSHLNALIETLLKASKAEALSLRKLFAHLKAKSPTSAISTQKAASATSAISTLKAASTTSSSDSMQTLIDNFKDVYISRRYTDITIVVKGNEFPAHKVILAARSVVFAAMFEYNMMEENSRIEISDCDPESFEKFLLFLYTGKFNVVSSSNAASLYKISEKYNVQELKEECRRCMEDEINVDIFCEVLHLSTIYNESNLLKSAIDFFKNNVKYILPTTKWQNLLVEHPIMCNSLLTKNLTNG